MSVIDDSRSINNKNITIVNDSSGVARMMSQLGASLMITILTTLEVSFTIIKFKFTRPSTIKQIVA
jgi:hypothetical protein